MQSKYESLPVYKKALDLAVHLEKTVKGFDRYNKYTLGTDLRNTSRAVLILICRANSKKHRSETLEEAIGKLEELKILIKLCHEVKAFKKFSSFEFAIKLVVEVLKQCEGWLRSQNSTEKSPGKRV